LKGVTEDLTAGTSHVMSQADIRACLDAIPNNRRDWIWFNNIGMRIYAGCDGADYGLGEWSRWADKNPEAGNGDSCADRWNAYHTSPPTRTSGGALINEARRALGDPSWLPPPPQSFASNSFDAPNSSTDTCSGSEAAVSQADWNASTSNIIGASAVM